MQPPLFGDVRGIVFDLDDTLCGYWDAAKAGLRAAFAEHGLPGVPPEVHVAAWAGVFPVVERSLKDPEVFAAYCRSGGPTRRRQMRETLRALGAPDDAEMEARADRLADAYRRERDRALRLFPESADVLRRLAAAYPLGMLTNGPADIQREEVITLGVGGWFTFIGIQGELGVGKPHRAAFARIERALDLEPPQILMVGNSFSADIRPAIAFGYRTAWVRRPSDVPPSAAPGAGPERMPDGETPPDLVVDDLRQILPHLPLAEG